MVEGPQLKGRDCNFRLKLKNTQLYVAHMKLVLHKKTHRFKIKGYRNSATYILQVGQKML